MYRKIYSKLIDWKKSETRYPLLLRGARQVGKSYLLQKFGAHEFSDCHIFNFEMNKSLFSTFENDLDPKRIIKDLSIISGKEIDTKTELVIFDEIQECPNALTSLKYFCEQMPRLHLCCAGSLLGVKLNSESFPVGKVEFIDMHPLCFEEFLRAMNDDIALELFFDFANNEKQSEIAHQKLWDYFREYSVTGGMPQVVKTYSKYRNNAIEAMHKARDIQNRLVESYHNDFAKHSGKENSLHIISIFENIPTQLSANIDSSVKRYQFKGVIQKKKSYVELQGPIEWLKKAGLILKVKKCNRSEIPFETFCKENIFKLFIFDIGLLGAMLDLPVNMIYTQNFGITKGYFAENFVAQEFVSNGILKLYSWSEKTSEIEFLSVVDNEPVPIEVKSGKRLQAKSLQQYILRYSPKLAIKLSGKPLKKNKTSPIQNYPLYWASKISPHCSSH